MKFYFFLKSKNTVQDTNMQIIRKCVILTIIRMVIFEEVTILSLKEFNYYFMVDIIVLLFSMALKKFAV